MNWSTNLFMKQITIKLGMKVSEVTDLSQNICDLYVTMTAKLDDSYLQNVMADLKDLSERISGVLKHTRLYLPWRIWICIATVASEPS